MMPASNINLTARHRAASQYETWFLFSVFSPSIMVAGWDENPRVGVISSGATAAIGSLGVDLFCARPRRTFYLLSFFCAFLTSKSFLVGPTTRYVFPHTSPIAHPPIHRPQSPVIRHPSSVLIRFLGPERPLVSLGQAPLLDRIEYAA